MGGRCTYTSRQCFKSAANIDHEGIGNGGSGDPVSSFILYFETVVRGGLKKESQEPRVFMGTDSLEFLLFAAGIRWRWIFDQLQFMLLRMVKSLIEGCWRKVESLRDEPCE